MTAKKTDIWMPLYVAEYLADTLHLSTEQHGAYMLMLMACWKNEGRIPSDDESLASITKLPLATWKKCRAKLVAFFETEGEWLRTKPLKRRQRDRIAERIRQWIFDRDGRKCLWCASPEHLSIDHIIAFVNGGSDDPENLQTLCRSCNSTKGCR